MDEQQHIALPQLYGAPAYARPPVAVAHTTRPVDRDDLPLEAAMTEDDRAALDAIPDDTSRVPGVRPSAHPTATMAPPAGLRPRTFSMRALAERIRRR